MRGINGTRHVLAAATGVALMLLSSACTSDSEATPTAPSFSPVPSESEAAPSATPSESPSEEPTTAALPAPELPPAATEETPEGAAAFAEWWFETLNYAFKTGDTDALRSASELGSCQSCANFIERVENAYSSGGGIEGGTLSVEVEKPNTIDDGLASFAVRVSAAEATETVNGETKDLPSGESVAAVAVFWRDGWVMGDIAA